jgi:hypothetical protein
MSKPIVFAWISLVLSIILGISLVLFYNIPVLVGPLSEIIIVCLAILAPIVGIASIILQILHPEHRKASTLFIAILGIIISVFTGIVVSIMIFGGLTAASLLQ